MKNGRQYYYLIKHDSLGTSEHILWHDLATDKGSYWVLRSNGETWSLHKSRWPNYVWDWPNYVWDWNILDVAKKAGWQVKKVSRKWINQWIEKHFDDLL